MTVEFKGFYKLNKKRRYNTWCGYLIRLDTYGQGCQHDCKYCYARALLQFRGLWRPDRPLVADIGKIERRIKTIAPGSVVKLGVMTDCFMPIEKEYRTTLRTIGLLNKYRVPYLIVTKSAIVADDEYARIYDKALAHFQITITFTDDEKCRIYESASPPGERIAAVEKLHRMGFDVSVRLSPFIPEFIDLETLRAIKCDKILIEFLKVNHRIRRCFDIDYSRYTHKYGGHYHLPLEDKIAAVDSVKGYSEVSVGEYVKDHYTYFRENVNCNKNDCCNLRVCPISGTQVTMDEWRALRDSGGRRMKHTWQLDESGDIDTFVMDADMHNGPGCMVCGESFCHHCDPNCYDEECPGHTPNLEEAIENISNMKVDGMSEQESRSIPVLLSAAKKWKKVEGIRT